MNGNPSAEQKRMHSAIRDLVPGCEIHHIFGSKWKVKGLIKPGEWLVLGLHPHDHRNLNDYLKSQKINNESEFETQRRLFFTQQTRLEHGAPEDVKQHYKRMLSKHG